jgi:hypothetical protein
LHGSVSKAVSTFTTQEKILTTTNSSKKRVPSQARNISLISILMKYLIVLLTTRQNFKCFLEHFLPTRMLASGDTAKGVRGHSPGDETSGSTTCWTISIQEVKSSIFLDYFSFAPIAYHLALHPKVAVAVLLMLLGVVAVRLFPWARVVAHHLSNKNTHYCYPAVGNICC